jgi:hypothetical protein
MKARCGHVEMGVQCTGDAGHVGAHGSNAGDLIAEQQARLGAIAEITRHMTFERLHHHELQVLARGTPRREVARLLAKWSKR